MQSQRNVLRQISSASRQNVSAFLTLPTSKFMKVCAAVRQALVEYHVIHGLQGSGKMEVRQPGYLPRWKGFRDWIDKTFFSF